MVSVRHHAIPIGVALVLAYQQASWNRVQCCKLGHVPDSNPVALVSQ
jgi:hypothetical protein